MGEKTNKLDGKVNFGVKRDFFLYQDASW